jgi:hypothetical protein
LRVLGGKEVTRPTDTELAALLRELRDELYCCGDSRWVSDKTDELIARATAAADQLQPEES